MKRALLIGTCLVLSACSSQALKLRTLPPKAKDVIDVVMASSQLPLSDSSCKGFGTEPTDATIGRYLAGYLAEQSNQDARNAVTTSIEPRTVDGRAVYVCRLMIRHAQGEDIWSWGIEFTASQSDGSVTPNSFRCLGAG